MREQTIHEDDESATGAMGHLWRALERMQHLGRSRDPDATYGIGGRYRRRRWHRWRGCTVGPSRERGGERGGGGGAAGGGGGGGKEQYRGGNFFGGGGYEERSGAGTLRAARPA